MSLPIQELSKSISTLETCMDPPVVYIEREPFLMILIATIETFKRECLGYLFGREPTKGRNSFIVTNVAAVQLARKRKNLEVQQSQLSGERMDDCCDKYPALFRFIGDFHSHPEWGRHKRMAMPSKQDIKAMIRHNIPVGIIITISSINKERILWQNNPDGGLKGSLGKYKFNINAWRTTKDDLGKPQIQRLTIQASVAMKSINRALGYK